MYRPCLTLVYECAYPCWVRLWVVCLGSELFSFFIIMDGSTALFSIFFSKGKQQTVQDISLICFYGIHCTSIISDCSFKKTSPVFDNKTFYSVFWGVHSIKNCNLLMEISLASQSGLLSSCKEIGPFSVSVQVSSTLNTIPGVISEPDLLCSTKEECLENLSEQNVIDVCQITVLWNDKMYFTKHILLNSPNFF